MIANQNFEGVVKGKLKKFKTGDTLTAAEVKELNAKSKGLVESEETSSTQEETKDDTTT